MTMALIVEHERVIALDLQRSLKRLGFDAVAVNTSDEALRVGPNLRPELVLMDLNLAGPLDGVETASRLRANFEFALIYVSGCIPHDQVQDAKGAAAVWLTKPFTPGDLKLALDLAITPSSRP